MIAENLSPHFRFRGAAPGSTSLLYHEVDILFSVPESIYLVHYFFFIHSAQRKIDFKAEFIFPINIYVAKLLIQ